MKELLELPWQAQIVIVGGYLGYVIAYAGKRAGHKNIDTFSIILCFGGISILTFEIIDHSLPELFPKFNIPYIRNVGLVLAALGTSTVCAILWRRLLQDYLQKRIRSLSKSENDDLYSAWDTIIQTKDLDYFQLNITLESGRVLESYPLGAFNDLPNGPCILGGDGSVGMYVTHIEDPNSERRAANNIDCEDEGARLTFIPASQIAEIDFRRKPKKQNR